MPGRKIHSRARVQAKVAEHFARLTPIAMLPDQAEADAAKATHGASAASARRAQRRDVERLGHQPRRHNRPRRVDASTPTASSGWPPANKDGDGRPTRRRMQGDMGSVRWRAHVQMGDRQPRRAGFAARRDRRSASSLRSADANRDGQISPEEGRKCASRCGPSGRPG